jgi:hypothetical protein
VPAKAGALALLIFSGLLTVVAIDHPFAGTVKVGPKALIAVIDDFGDKALMTRLVQLRLNT